MMTMLQAGQAPPAPTPPPIPPLPSQPGGSGTADAQRAIENAIQATENAIATTGQSVQRPGMVQVSPDIPPEVVPMLAIIFGSVVVMVVLTPIVRGIMRMIERRQDKSLVHGPAVAQQLAQLQQSIDTLAIEVERISESQRFQAKILAERDRPAIGGGESAGR